MFAPFFLAVPLVVLGQATRRSLAWILRIAGLHWIEVTTAYGDSPRWKRALSRLSGPVAIYAAVALVHALALPPMMQASTLTIDPVPDMPAERAGVLPGDRVLALDGRAVSDWQDLAEGVASSKLPAVELRLKRGDDTVSLLIERTADAKIGVHSRLVGRSTTAEERLEQAVVGPWRNLHRSVQAIAMAASTGRDDAVGGPIILYRVSQVGDFPGSALVVMTAIFAQALPIAMLVDLIVFGVLVHVSRRRSAESASGCGRHEPGV